MYVIITPGGGGGGVSHIYLLTTCQLEYYFNRSQWGWNGMGIVELYILGA